MIVVIGDVLLDRDIRGSVKRLAPDAPVPVLSDIHVGSRLGGAGLAADRIREQGEYVTLVAPVSDDREGNLIHVLAHQVGIDLHALDTSYPTRIKERFSTTEQVLFRVDHGENQSPPHSVDSGELANILDRADALLVSDYGGGTTSDPAIRRAIERCRERIPVIWDPHPRGAVPLQGLALVTPNRSEAGVRDGEVAERAMALAKEWDAAVVITTGAAGAVLVTGPDQTHCVTADVVEGDACGAGDAFAAAATIALAHGFPLPKAVEQAVSSATEWVRREKWQESQKKIVATGGCFDLLHIGHIATLTAAARLGDHLIVLINSDSSVTKLKGTGRPINSQDSRAALLKALSVVDEVIIFDEPTPERVLRSIKPDFWVKGGDYQEADLPESRLLAQWGGQTVIVPYFDGYSTTALAERSVDLRRRDTEIPIGEVRL